jgi:hypothetical protein
VLREAPEINLRHLFDSLLVIKPPLSVRSFFWAQHLHEANERAIKSEIEDAEPREFYEKCPKKETIKTIRDLVSTAHRLHTQGLMALVAAR